MMETQVKAKIKLPIPNLSRAQAQNLLQRYEAHNLPHVHGSQTATQIRLEICYTTQAQPREGGKNWLEAISLLKLRSARRPVDDKARRKFP